MALPASMRIGFTTICVTTELYGHLESLKVHPRQPFHEVISTAVSLTGQHGQPRRR